MAQQDVEDRDVMLSARVPLSMRIRVRQLALWRSTTLEHEVQKALERYLEAEEQAGRPSGGA